MLDEVDIIYEKDQYIVFEGGNNDYIIYNTNKSFKKGHTHLKSFQRVKEVIESMVDKKFPLAWSNYFIVSMIRLSDCESFTQQLKRIHEVRLAKGRKKKYHNKPKYLR